MRSTSWRPTRSTGNRGPITSLVITDGGDRPVGVIHLHDILRAKIV